jgi:polyhydroxyalkanoate synthesis regulator phasin
MTKLDEKKINTAIETVSKLIDDLSSPDMMTREEALDFYAGLVDDIGMKREALEEVKDA